jgi:hypothetical protein
MNSFIGDSVVLAMLAVALRAGDFPSGLPSLVCFDASVDLISELAA